LFRYERNNQADIRVGDWNWVGIRKFIATAQGGQIRGEEIPKPPSWLYRALDEYVPDEVMEKIEEDDLPLLVAAVASAVLGVSIVLSYFMGYITAAPLPIKRKIQ
jgi:hypothetical protein